MTVNIEYRNRKTVGNPYGEIMVVCASWITGWSLMVVNVVLTDNGEDPPGQQRGPAMWTHRQMYYHSQCWSTIRHQILNVEDFADCFNGD